jgi:serine protease Do
MVTAAVSMTVAAAARAQAGAGAAEQGGSAPTSAVFRRYSDRVVKIHVIETGSAAKAVLGSGFYVTPDGHVITNYHVISKLVHDPTRYRAELIDTRGTTTAVTVLAIDAVHDLAVLSSGTRPDHYFTLRAVAVPQGTRLYSLGHPEDLGLSIVEGTDNGILEYTLYPKIHFTGAINSGMSGGPAITDDGVVAGVNVATQGDEISFLVPVERATSLLDRALAPSYVPPPRFLDEVGRQLLAYQDVYLAHLFNDSTPTVTLGRYTLPTRPAPYFKCWADASHPTRELLFRRVEHECSTDDYIFISADQSSGIVSFRHELITSDVLDALRFASLYSSRFGAGTDGLEGSEEEVTRFSCETRNVRRTGSPPRPGFTARAVLCVRRYRKLAGLYDAVIKIAALGDSHAGMISTLTLSGVSFENAQRVTQRFLERMQWGG